MRLFITILSLSLFTAVSAYAEETLKLKVAKINGAKVIVSGNVGGNIIIGDKLSVGNGRDIVLESVSPMQASCVCKILKGSLSKIKPGMKVSRFSDYNDNGSTISQLNTAGKNLLEDSQSGLLWAKNTPEIVKKYLGEEALVSGITWEEAQRCVFRMNSESYMGHNNWRLPMLAEMVRLIGKFDKPREVMIRSGFNPMDNPLVWTMETVIEWYYPLVTKGVDKAETVSLDSGDVYGKNKSKDKCGFLVVSSITENKALERFIVKEKVIEDKLTGNMWIRDANSVVSMMPDLLMNQGRDATSYGLLSFGQAEDYVEELNKRNYLGYNDWRVPDVEDFYTFAYFTENSLDGWLISNGFENIKPYRYMTMTKRKTGVIARQRVVIVMGSGYINSESPAPSGFVMIVRGGNKEEE